MKKKLLPIIIIILIIIAGGVGLYFFLQKGESQTELFTDQRYSTEPTGFDLIQADLDEGKLDLETALIYKVKYLFGDTTLPTEYITEATPFEDDGTLADVQENWDNFSQETKDTLTPYFKRPDDPESFLNQAYTASWGQEETGFLKLIDAAYAYDRPVAYKTENALVTADGKIKVWYPIKIVMQGGEEKEIKLYHGTAQKIVSNLNKDGAYAQYVGLLGKIPPSDGTLGGDEKTDIYLATGAYVHLADSNGGTPSLGVNVPDNGTGSSSFIVIRENLNDKNLKTTTVHELFHAFQRAFDCWLYKKNWWWIEGTATWSEDLIYPKENSEQGYVDDFIPKPDTSLFKNGSNFEYGAYVFPFYLSKTYDRSIITKVFEGCNASTDPLNSAEQNIDGGFKKNWKEFTLWNYNKKPVENYKNADLSKTFPADSSESGGNGETNFISGLGETAYSTKELASLTAEVITFPLMDENNEIRKMTFKDLKNFTTKTDKAGIKAVIYPKTGLPYVEDWTEKDSRSFCFDKTDENLEKVVLVFSNAELKNKIAEANLKIKNTNSCFDIDQNETMTVKPLFAVTPGYVGTLKYQAEGELFKDSVPASAKYAYLGKWKVKVNYLEQFPAQRIYSIVASAMDFAYNHWLEFDLSVDSVTEDGTFEAITKEGKFETPGWTITEEITGESVTVPKNATPWDVPQKGVISEMTENGCKISLPDFVLYNSGGYRDLPHPIIFEIKKD